MMRKSNQRKVRDLSSFESFKLNNLKVINGGLGDTGGSDGGPIDPPKHPGDGNGNGTGNDHPQ